MEDSSKREQILEKIAQLERDLECLRAIGCGTPALRTRVEIEELQQKLRTMTDSSNG